MGGPPVSGASTPMSRTRTCRPPSMASNVSPSITCTTRASTSGMDVAVGGSTVRVWVGAGVVGGAVGTGVGIRAGAVGVAVKSAGRETGVAVGGADRSAAVVPEVAVGRATSTGVGVCKAVEAVEAVEAEAVGRATGDTTVTASEARPHTPHTITSTATIASSHHRFMRLPAFSIQPGSKSHPRVRG
jgi:hypothetical protein